MKIGICNDHAGVEYKFKLVKMLQKRGIEVVNFGTDTTDSVDYPDFAHKLAYAVENGEVDLGIALCGTGSAIWWRSTTTPTCWCCRPALSATAWHRPSCANGWTPRSRAAATRSASTRYPLNEFLP